VKPLEPRSSTPSTLRNLPFLDRKAALALARLLRDSEAGILLNEHVAEDGSTVSVTFAAPGWWPFWCRMFAGAIFAKYLLYQRCKRYLKHLFYIFASNAQLLSPRSSCARSSQPAARGLSSIFFACDCSRSHVSSLGSR
jgi:hypothetical protein